VKVFLFGVELGVGFLVPAIVFSLAVAITVEMRRRVSERRYRQRDYDLYDLGPEGAAARRQEIQKPRNQR
jgi:uncharacterized membrane protein YhiD involved in acid resistance